MIESNRIKIGFTPTQTVDLEIVRKEIMKKYKLDESFLNVLIHEWLIRIYPDWSCHIDNMIDEKFTDYIKENPEILEIINDISKYIYDESNKDFFYYSFLFDYLLLHNTLDKLVWTMRLQYSDKKIIKNRKYRLDVLFQEIIKFNINNINKEINPGKSNLKLSKFHLKKAWYNELVRSVPFTEGYMDLSISIDSKVPVWYWFWWNLTQSYYSFYEYLNNICFCFNDEINTKQHQKSINIFNNWIFSELKYKTLLYPFNISSNFIREKDYPKHYKYQYALYPRSEWQNLKELEDNLQMDLKKLSKKGELKTIIDQLYELRIWANYTWIDSLVRLHNWWYMKFMYKNITTLLFVFAWISEITFIKSYGEKEIVNLLRWLFIDYISKNEEFNNSDLNPIFIRFKIYKHLWIISKDIDISFMERKSNSIKYI